MAVPAPSAATAAASALIALLSAVPPTVQAQDPADAVDPVDPMALLAELAAEPRVAGTAGYARAVAIVARELNAVRGTSGAFFARDPGIQTVLGDERVFEHCIYTLANDRYEILSVAIVMALFLFLGSAAFASFLVLRSLP